MDEIVKAAMLKWPKVPHCYGWLALDERGVWRMRDERTQALNLAGDAIRNAGLRDFINRNYQVDEKGCWYFQNGPQKVYVDLLATPYIAHVGERGLWQLHTGEMLAPPSAAYIIGEGKLVLRSKNVLAQVDDRDLGYALDALCCQGKALSEQDLENVLQARPGQNIGIRMTVQGTSVSVEKTTLEHLILQEKYCLKPRDNA